VFVITDKKLLSGDLTLIIALLIFSTWCQHGNINTKNIKTYPTLINFSPYWEKKYLTTIPRNMFVNFVHLKKKIALQI